MRYYPVIRKFAIENRDGVFNNILWIEEDWGDFEPMRLLRGENIKLELGNTICIRCRKSISRDQEYCDGCEEEQSDFRTRLQCLFGKQPMLHYSSCKKSSYSCNLPANASFCFQKYVLYLGRFGNTIKVGITRKYRKGTFMSRLIEQGLNEAIVVDGFSSLPEVILEEKWLMDTGIADLITRQDKLREIGTISRSITDNCGYTNCDLVKSDSVHYSDLSSIWNEKLMKEKYADRKIIHLSIYPELENIDLELLDHPKRVAGEIIEIIGNFMILLQENKKFGISLNDIINKEIKGGMNYHCTGFN